MAVLPESVREHRSPPTVYDVALAAEVSHMTVSRAMNGQPGMTDKTRERVLAVAQALGYVRNPSARALAGGLAPHIRVLVARADPEASARAARGFQQAAARAGLTVGVQATDPLSDDAAATALQELAAAQVRGLCVIADDPPPVDPAVFTAPLVSVSLGGVRDGAVVAIDRAAGRQAAIGHLVALGHTDIVCAGRQPGVRHDSASRPSASAGIRVRLLDGDDTSDFGFRVGSDAGLMGAATAVVASSDHVALGVVHGLRERGRSVPLDVSVVGWGDLPEARHYLPALTTVADDAELAGEAAFDRLHALVEGRAALGDRVILPRLVVRASSAPRG